MAIKSQLMLPADYVDDASRLITQAKIRVAFISMIITDDAATSNLIDTLAAAAQRGIRVDVAADMYTYTELSGMFFPSHYHSKNVRSTTRMVKEFEQAKVHFNWLGRFSVTTFSGRTHSKWCVIDDTVYAFGGVNIYQAGIENTDFMLKIQNADLATILVNEHHRITRADKGRYSYRSYKIEVGDDTVLIDGGFLGDSIIYRRACDLAKEAKNVTLVSQYCPTGKLHILLKKTKTKFYFNPWQKATGFNRLIIRVGTIFSKQESAYNRDNYLHAKFILFTMKDGSKVAITGSHNFVYGGVLVGTREIALETRNPAIIEQLEKFVQRYIA